MKAIIRTIIVVLLIAAVAGIGWVSYGFREWDTNEWKNEIEDLTEEQPVVDSDGNVLDPDGVNDLPESMIFGSALNLAGEATSVTVKATVKPDNAKDPTVDWSVFWSENTSWSNGKNPQDYVSVTPQSDGSNIVTLSCKSSFRTQITLECRSRSNPEIYATSTIDYISSYRYFTISQKYVGNAFDNEDDQSIAYNFDLYSSKEIYFQMPEYIADLENEDDNYSIYHYDDASISVVFNNNGSVTPDKSTLNLTITAYYYGIEGVLIDNGFSVNVSSGKIIFNDALSEFEGLSPEMLIQTEKNGVQYDMSICASYPNITESQSLINLITQYCTVTSSDDPYIGTLVFTFTDASGYSFSEDIELYLDFSNYKTVSSISLDGNENFFWSAI